MQQLWSAAWWLASRPCSKFDITVQCAMIQWYWRVVDCQKQVVLCINFEQNFDLTHFGKQKSPHIILPIVELCTPGAHQQSTIVTEALVTLHWLYVFISCEKHHSVKQHGFHVDENDSESFLFLKTDLLYVFQILHRFLYGLTYLT